MSDWQPGDYTTADGHTATVVRIKTYYVGDKRYVTIEGSIDGNPVGWDTDGRHSYGNYVLPGHADFDLVQN